MPVSSVSDFEHFAEKIKKKTRTKVRKIEAETADYLLQTKNEAEHKINTWLKHAQTQWGQERNAKEQQSLRRRDEEVKRQWSAFKIERTSALREALRIRLEKIFPALAECFISRVSQQYQTGSFTMPEAYMTFIKEEGFIFHLSEKEEIVFRSGNLYIEYSLDRIMEELDAEINLGMEETWQA